jgi:thiamine biosynthesis lipoprotein
MSMNRRTLLLGLGASTAGALLLPRLGGLIGGGVPTIRQQLPALGTLVTISVRCTDTQLARQSIGTAARAIMAVHQTMTLFGPSPLTDLNTLGLHSAQRVPDGLWEVLQASGRLHALSAGLFDPTLGHWHQVQLLGDERSVQLHDPAAQIDLNGIAKGYAVDCAVQVLRAAGLTDFLVNAGGDIYAAGSESEWTRSWTIGLHLGRPDPNPVHSFQISEQAIATSGNVHTEHLRHPLLGEPLMPPRLSTAIAPTVIEADAWSTAAFVGELPTELPTGVRLHRT